MGPVLPATPVPLHPWRTSSRWPNPAGAREAPCLFRHGIGGGEWGWGWNVDGLGIRPLLYTVLSSAKLREMELGCVFGASDVSNPILMDVLYHSSCAHENSSLCTELLGLQQTSHSVQWMGLLDSFEWREQR